MDNYETFYRTFLAEMPQRVPGGNDFAAQLEMLQENLKYDAEVFVVSPSVFKAEVGDQTTYWAGNEDATEVSLIVDTSVNGNFCRVVLSSKNPAIPRGSKPYAGDLYLLIKQDVSPAHLVFSSDMLLSSDGESLWKGLVSRGNAVSVYDTSTQQYVLDKVDSADTLDNYIGGPDKQRYLFVLSESDTYRQGVIHMSKIMELKRMTLYPQSLFEQYTKKE